MLKNGYDESDHENLIRLVILPCYNFVDLKEIMNHLFATIYLNSSYLINNEYNLAKCLSCGKKSS